MIRRIQHQITQALDRLNREKEEILAKAFDTALGQGNWTPQGLEGRCHVVKGHQSTTERLYLDGKPLVEFYDTKLDETNMSCAKFTLKYKILVGD